MLRRWLPSAKSGEERFVNPNATRLAAFFGLVLVLMLAACGETASVAPLPTLSPAEANNLTLVTGQLVFVPAYSQVVYGSGNQTLALNATLAIHNTDPDDPIIIRSVRYYDTDGTLVRDFIDSPVQLGPLATTGFVVIAGETPGGWGTNFMVEWGAPEAVYEPIIEAVMVSQRGAEGVSFISPGRVVSETQP
jgi:hypothetical protein